MRVGYVLALLVWYSCSSTGLTTVTERLSSQDRSELPFVLPHVADERYPARMQFQTVQSNFYFRHVLVRAALRLHDAECDQVFSDFMDDERRTLAERLSALGETSTQFLSELSWVDVSDEDACRRNGLLAAYTTPGARTIFVCGSRFVDSTYSLRGVQGEMIVIHEMLHALGLNENPPTSAQITARVTRRCGY